MSHEPILCTADRQALMELADALRNNSEYDIRGPFLRFEDGRLMKSTADRLAEIANRSC